MLRSGLRAHAAPAAAGRATSSRCGARVLGEQQVDEALGGRLRLVVGEAGPLVGLDEDVLGPVDGGHEQVEPGDRDVEGAAGAPRRRSARAGCSSAVTSWMVPPVCRLAVRRTASTSPSGSTSCSWWPGLGARRRAVTSSTGMRDSPPVAAARRRLCALDELGDVVHPVADDRGRPADGGGDDLVVDDDDAQVLAGDAAPRAARRGRTGGPARRPRPAPRRCARRR